MLNKLKIKYNQLKEDILIFVWKIRLEIDYRLWLITRNVEGAF